MSLPKKKSDVFLSRMDAMDKAIGGINRRIDELRLRLNKHVDSYERQRADISSDMAVFERRLRVPLVSCSEFSELAARLRVLDGVRSEFVEMKGAVTELGHRDRIVDELMRRVERLTVFVEEVRRDRDVVNCAKVGLWQRWHGMVA